jgi:hypothetical protein
MMKKIILISLIACAAFSSCENFLTQDPYTTMPDDAAITNNVNANYALAGIYDRMQNEFFFGRMFLVAPEATTENLVLSASNSNRYVAEAQWTMTPATSDVASMWLYGYWGVTAANKILEKIDGIDATVQQRQQIKGEALALRGMLHLYLVRMYAHDYTTNPDDLGIPYMEKSIIYEQPARDKLSTTFDKIIRDLSEGADLLTQSGVDNGPFRLNAWAAKALMAKAYMTKLDYDAAKPVLKDIIDNSGYKLLSNADYGSAWSKHYDARAKTEFLFAISNLSTDYGATTSLGYIFLEAGYGDLLASDAIYSLYTTTDVRRDAFFKANTKNASIQMVDKYPSRDGSSGLSDNPVVRLSDVYLLYAEACANTNEEANAVKYLDEVRQRCDPQAAASTETGQALKDKILLERRKELAFEGEYYHDLKRNKLPIPTAYNAQGTNKTVGYPDDRRAFPIPQDEIDANPNMEQNRGYN